LLSEQALLGRFLDNGALYADIVTPHEEEDFAGYW